MAGRIFHICWPVLEAPTQTVEDPKGVTTDERMKSNEHSRRPSVPLVRGPPKIVSMEASHLYLHVPGGLRQALSDHGIDCYEKGLDLILKSYEEEILGPVESSLLAAQQFENGACQELHAAPMIPSCSSSS